MSATVALFCTKMESECASGTIPAGEARNLVRLLESAPDDTLALLARQNRFRWCRAVAGRILRQRGAKITEKNPGKIA